MAVKLYVMYWDDDAGTYTELTNVTLYAEKIVETITGKNVKTPIRNISRTEQSESSPVYLNLGYTSVELNLSGYINETDPSLPVYTEFIKIFPDMLIMVDSETDSNYEEFGDGITFWEVDSLNVKRTQSYGTLWSYKIGLIRQFKVTSVDEKGQR